MIPYVESGMIYTIFSIGAVPRLLDSFLTRTIGLLTFNSLN